MIKRTLSIVSIALLLLVTGCTTQPPSDRQVKNLEAGLSCDCDYRNKSMFKSGGCKIVDPAPPGMACYCKYQGFWTCSGAIAVCENPDSPDCRNPSRNKASCEQGGGDCGGYQD